MTKAYNYVDNGVVKTTVSPGESNYAHPVQVVTARGAATAIVVAASPYTYTAGTGSEIVSVAGGTVTSIVAMGVTTGYTNGNFSLQAGGTLVVTYSVVPVMISNSAP